MVALTPQRLEDVRGRIQRACERSGRDPAEITIVAVTKSHPVEAIVAAVEAGLLDVGENRVQEGLAKLPHVPPQARVHLIGSLQLNKVNKAVGAFASIASVDRPALLEKIARRAAGQDRVQPIWIQVNVTAEEQKGGCAPDRCAELWASALALPSVDPRGLMAIGRFGAGEAKTRADFARVRRLAEPLRTREDGRVGLSVGMSDDFEWAILEGSTQIRLGTVLFGPRPA